LEAMPSCSLATTHKTLGGWYAINGGHSGD